MTEHELKTWPEFFKDVISGKKKFEVREDDRGFEVGDTLWLQEWDPKSKAYTGHEIRVKVTYILRRLPMLAEGYVIMSIGPIEDCSTAEDEIYAKGSFGTLIHNCQYRGRLYPDGGVLKCDACQGEVKGRCPNCGGKLIYNRDPEEGTKLGEHCENWPDECTHAAGDV